MYSEKESPLSMSPAGLDEYLARGWYRMGQTIFTTTFLNINKGIHSALWLRLTLKGFGFSKSQRKLLRKNDEIFRYEIKDENLDAEKEKLFDKYKVHFNGKLFPCLKTYLYDNQEGNIFNTKEINVYHGDKLVAYSFFDLGQNSLASIQGVYDPDYYQYSLGYYTMLLEMVYGLENNYKYFYPGYVAPGNTRFDYKTRIGDVDYYETVTKEWLPFKAVTKATIPLEVLKSKLKTLQAVLEEAQIKTTAFFYPYYEAPVIVNIENNLLNHPFFLMREMKDEPFRLLVSYDVNIGQYVCFLCFKSLNFSANNPVSATDKFEGYFNYMADVLETVLAIPPTNSIQKILMIFSAKIKS